MKRMKKWLACLVAAGLLVSSLPGVGAVSSAELWDEIEELEAHQGQLDDRMEALQAEMDRNWASIEEMVAYKNNIDEQMFLQYQEIDNLRNQILRYNLLIVDTQQQLDQAEAQLDALNEKYKARICAMEEEGEMSIWSVIFRASSFLDLLDRLNMIQEIAQADRRMLDRLSELAQEVESTRERLLQEKDALEASRSTEEEIQAELESLRAEADRVLQELNANRQEMAALDEQYHQEKEELDQQIAAAEKAYTEAKRREEMYHGSVPSVGANGWLQPCAYVYLSSPYGYRSSGFHNGVDFAAYRGTPIYATRSGTVTTAVSLTYSYGNYVVINHGDGFSSLYAHMDYYVAYVGQYVEQGQLIGYVGSTGNHLHFSIFYDGSSVNPMAYL